MPAVRKHYRLMYVDYSSPFAGCGLQRIPEVYLREGKPTTGSSPVAIYIPRVDTTFVFQFANTLLK